MYNSLLEIGCNFHLYILAIDDKCAETLNKMSLDKVTVITLGEFETAELKSKKRERSRAEYCWTCTSFLIGYVLSKYSLDEVTYLDADLCFYSNPQIIADEFHKTNCDTMLVRHNYSPDVEFQSETSGIYNVEYNTFKNTDNGWEILRWWQERCLEWCGAHIEKNKLGDQKYLDFIPELFNGAYVLKNIGGGVAPWNVKKYHVSEGSDGKFYVNDTGIVFYHFHHFRWYNLDRYEKQSGYKVFEETAQKEIVDIYDYYFKRIVASADLINSVAPEFEPLCDNDIEAEHRNGWNNIIKPKLNRGILLDTLHSIANNDKIAIWGNGNNGRKILQFFNKYGIENVTIADSNYDGVQSISPSIFEDNKYFVIVTPNNYYDSIFEQLKEWGYRGDIDYMHISTFKDIVYHRLMERLSDNDTCK